jgi:hypothetical protein
MAIPVQARGPHLPPVDLDRMPSDHRDHRGQNGECQRGSRRPRSGQHPACWLPHRRRTYRRGGTQPRSRPDVGARTPRAQLRPPTTLTRPPPLRNSRARTTSRGPPCRRSADSRRAAARTLCAGSATANPGLVASESADHRQDQCIQVSRRPPMPPALEHRTIRGTTP